MHASITLGAGAVAAALLFITLPVDPPRQPNGHFALVVEGNVSALRVTHVVKKAEPCGMVPKGLTSEFALSVVDDQGKELWRQPLDLSQFDTDPAHIGRPVQVTGCIVKDSRIAALVNLPDYPDGASVSIWRGQQQIGNVATNDLRQLAGGGK